VIIEKQPGAHSDADKRLLETVRKDLEIASPKLGYKLENKQAKPPNNRRTKKAAFQQRGPSLYKRYENWLFALLTLSVVVGFLYWALFSETH
jgi:hypothetical protein